MPVWKIQPRGARGTRGKQSLFPKFFPRDPSVPRGFFPYTHLQTDLRFHKSCLAPRNHQVLRFRLFRRLMNAELVKPSLLRYNPGLLHLYIKEKPSMIWRFGAAWLLLLPVLHLFRRKTNVIRRKTCDFAILRINWHRVPKTRVALYREEDGSCPFIEWFDKLPAKV